MKILTEEEKNGIETLTKGRGGARHPVYAEIKKLQVGQALLIETSDWSAKTPPGVNVHGAFRDGRKFSVRTLADRSGWLVTRLA